MAKRKNDINNEIAYFYTVIKNMDTKDGIKQSKINEHEIPVDEILYDNFSDDFDMDKQVSEQNLLGWIELIENENLYNAVIKLTEEEQVLLSYLFYKDKTQTETSKLLNMSQQKLNYRLHNIFLKIKNFFIK